MSLREDIRRVKTGDRDLRSFGLLVGGVLAAIGLVLLLRHRLPGPYLLAAGALLVALGALRPRVLKPVCLAWMGAALAIGFVMANVILTLFFFLVVTPVALAGRLAGRRFLDLKPDRRATSYWIRRSDAPLSPADYERQF